MHTPTGRVELRRLDSLKNKVNFIVSGPDKVLVLAGAVLTSRWPSVRPIWPTLEPYDVDLSHRKKKRKKKKMRDLRTASNRHRYDPVQDSNGCGIEQ